MFDANRIDDVINLGALEVWDIENTTNMAHPFHIHGNSFQVVSRTNGVRPLQDYELGWTDVVVVYSRETVRIIKSFEDYADPEGPYMSHCHILEHEDVGMMTHWVVVDQATSVEEASPANPINFTLEQNYPNPFNPTTTIRFSLPQSASVTLTVYNMLGQKVAALVENEVLTAGEHSMSFEAGNLSTGVYIYLLAADDFTSYQKMILQK